MLRQAVVLVGGLGTRLGERTQATPKPMLDVGGRPFLDYILDELSRYRLFERILLLAGHLGEQVVDRYDGTRRRSTAIQVVREPAPLGTGGALAHAREYLDETFLLLNGDSFFDINLLDLASVPLPADALVRMALKSDHEGGRYGRVRVEAGNATAFFPSTDRVRGPINAGIYVMRKDVLDAIDSSPCSLENAVLVQLAERGQIQAKIFDGYFIDIGVPADYARADAELPRHVQRPAIFFDRDGVLNKDTGYVHRIEEFEWVEGAREAVKLCNDRGYFVFVVTNQAGVARGYYGIEAVERLHGWMDDELALVGAHVEEFAYCPHHPEASVPEFRKNCDRRKPYPGMLLDCLKKWPTNRQRSLLIGDKDTDMEAASAASVQSLEFAGGNLLSFVSRFICPKDS